MRPRQSATWRAPGCGAGPRRRSRWRPAPAAARRAVGRRRLEGRQRTRLAQACQLVLTECIEVGGHGRVTVLEIAIADAAQPPTIAAMKTRIASDCCSLRCTGPGRRLRQTRTGTRSRLGQGGPGAQSRLEILSTDETAGIFTVRDTRRAPSNVAPRRPGRCAAAGEGEPRQAGDRAAPVHPPTARPSPPTPGDRPSRSNYRNRRRGRRRGRAARRRSGLQHHARCRAEPGGRGGQHRRPGLQHHARTARQRARAARMPRPWRPMSKSAPIPSSARAIA